jgi:replicative DNA helicase
VTATFDAPPDEQDLGRVPPQDIDAEQSVLGSELLSPNAVSTVVDRIGNGEAFYRPAHTTIHRAIVALWRAGQRADPITVTDALRASGDLQRVGGPAYIHELVDSVPTAANADYYAEIVHRCYQLRTVIEAGTRLVQMGFAAARQQEDTATVVEQAVVELQKLATAAAGDGNGREWGMDKVVEATLEAYYGETAQALPVPWTDLSVMAPMEPGELVVIAAPPGMGKTVALVDIARHAAIQHGRRILISSMEMSHVQIGQRILAAEAKVGLHNLRQKTLDQWGQKRLDEAAARILAAPMRIDDTPAVPVSQWRTRLRQMKAERVLPDGLMIDYLQIAKAEAKANANRTGEVDQLARDLKSLAQEFQIVVVAAAQLSRKVADRPDKKPMMSDLRESGGIEQNASIVILLHREDYYDKTSPRSGEMDMIVAKNRQGPTGTITVAFKSYQATAVDMATE